MVKRPREPLADSNSGISEPATDKGKTMFNVFLCSETCPFYFCSLFIFSTMSSSSTAIQQALSLQAPVFRGICPACSWWGEPSAADDATCGPDTVRSSHRQETSSCARLQTIILPGEDCYPTWCSVSVRAAENCTARAREDGRHHCPTKSELQKNRDGSCLSGPPEVQGQPGERFSSMHSWHEVTSTDASWAKKVLGWQ